MDATEFKLKIAQLPRPETEKRPPYWDYWRMALYDWVLTNDPKKFYECPAVYHTMLVNHWSRPVRYEFEHLSDRLKLACYIPHFGPFDHLEGTKYSMNLIHQAYHIQTWEQATGRRIDLLDSVIEFGGGYGAMALLYRRLGFEGKYVIYDLPEFSLLQEYYLSQFGLAGMVEWNPVEKPAAPDLFMALYSLSEVELEKRLDFVPPAKSFLFIYSGPWESYDNVSWFRNFAMSTPLEWRHTEISWLPDRNNWYSVGW